MEILTFYINAIMMLLLARYSMDFNSELKEKIEHLDVAVYTFIEKVKNGEAKSALDVTGSFFGILAISHFTLLFISALASIKNELWTLYISTVLLYSAVVWVAIKWFTSYEKFSLKFLKDISMFSLYLLVIPIMSYLVGDIGLIKLFFSFISRPLSLFGIDIVSTGVIWKDGLLVVLIIEILIIIYWLITSLVFLPIAASGFFIVFLSIQSARLLSKISPERPLSPLCFIIWLITAPYGWF